MVRAVAVAILQRRAGLAMLGELRGSILWFWWGKLDSHAGPSYGWLGDTGNGLCSCHHVSAG